MDKKIRFITTLSANVFTMIAFVLCYSFAIFILFLVMGNYSRGNFSESFLAKVMVILPIPLLTYMAQKSYSEMQKLRKRIAMAENPAQFKQEHIGCYVGIRGKFRGEKAFILPFSKMRCSFAHLEIFAEWTTKQKKPQRGVDFHHKPLLRKKTAEEVEIVTEKGSVWVNMEEFYPPFSELSRKEFHQQECPPQVMQSAEKRYHKYHVIERWLVDGDVIIVQGRLALRQDGRFFIERTNLLEFPAFFSVRNKTAGQRRKEIIQNTKEAFLIKLVNFILFIVLIVFFLYTVITGRWPVAFFLQ